MDLSLGRMKDALRRIGGLPCRSVQILGTNGKGSTCVFISALATAHGLKTGTYLSPHFISIRERILIAGNQLSENIWLDAANELAKATRVEDLTYFEVLTLMAVLIFRRERIKFAVIEAGLGGAHDATTALAHDCHCYTPIALDHTATLGPTLAQIARDKALAMQPHSRVFSARQYPAATAVLREVAQARACSIEFAPPVSLPADMTMAGNTQMANAGLALACWRWLAAEYGLHADAEKDLGALRSARLGGRMEYIPASGRHPSLVLDGGHNPHAIQHLLAQLPVPVENVIYSALADKDWHTCLGLLARLKVPVLLPQLGNSRAADVHEMAAVFPEATPVAEGLARALELVEGTTLVCGSLYLLAEYYKLFPRQSL